MDAAIPTTRGDPVALMLLLAFVFVPIIELAVIVQVGSVIGVPWTVLLLAVDSIAGAVVVRREGRRAWAAFRTALAEARWPGDEVAQGALVLVGGALLLTPGFVTDVLGLSFVLPPTRRLWSVLIRRRMTVSVVGGPIVGGQGGSGEGPTRRGPEVLDVEVIDVRRNDPPESS